MKSLFQIGDDIRALDDLLFELEGEVTDTEIEAAIDQWLAENKDNLFAKIDGYCALIGEREALAKARQDEAQRLSDLAQHDTNRVTRLRARLKAFFELHDITKMETHHHKLTIAKNGGTLPLIVNPVWLADPANAPEQFHKVRIDLDKEAIREALRNDEPVEGCAVGERGTHLRIK